MRILILFSLWASDKSENSQQWLKYYSHVLQNKFREDSKFIAVNGCDKSIYSDYFRRIDNTLSISRVADDKVVDSDASGYQHALFRCKDLINQYDAVCFFHTKGISYDFSANECLRNELSQSIFDRGKIVDALQRHDRSIVALKGYMAPSYGAIDHFNELAAATNIALPSIHYAATLTLYAVSSHVLCELLNGLPDRILTENLLSIGENRYFFEGMFPSLLTAKGARPVFMSGERFESGLNHNISYEALPAHSSAIVSREFQKCSAEGEHYKSRPFPYVIGDFDDVKKIGIIFE